MASFATPAELAAYANTTLNTSRMQAMLDYASGLIRRFTSQTISQVLGDSVEFGPQGHVTVFLPQWPVTDVTSVTLDGAAVTDVVWYRSGRLILPDVVEDGCIVVYDHGWESTSDEIAAVKAVCLSAASRAFTMNEQSASEVLGSTLTEAAGYAPEVFLTPGEKEVLDDLSGVAVG